MNEEVTIAIQDGEKEKTFVIQKMNAFQAESWLTRAGLLLGREAVNVNDFKSMSEIVTALCRLNYNEAKPLLDELLSCCYVKSGKYKKQISENMPELISSPLTLMRLRVESFKANFAFLASGGNFASLVEQVSAPTATA